MNQNIPQYDHNGNMMDPNSGQHANANAFAYGQQNEMGSAMQG